MNNDERLEYFDSRITEAASERTEWENRWQDVNDYILPWKAGVTTEQTPGSKQTTKIYSSHPAYCANILTGGLAGNLITKAPWYGLRTRDPNGMKAKNNEVWLQDSSERMSLAQNSSNFERASQLFLTDFHSYGTGHIYSKEDVQDILRFYVFPINQLYPIENERGIIDTTFRVYKASLRQLIREFGVENVHKETIEAHKNTPDARIIQVVHATYPRESWDPRLENKENRPWGCLYYQKDKKKILQESGHYDNPWHWARWMPSDQGPWGRGPGIDAMPAIKTLNAKEKTNLRVGQKNADPPWWLNSRMKGAFRTTLGAANVGNPGDRPPQKLTASDNVPHLKDDIDRSKAEIDDAYYVKLFMMLQAGQGAKTAFEVDQIIKQGRTILGPVLGGMDTECFAPMIERQFNHMARVGKLSPPPQSMQGHTLDIEYISPLAKLLKMQELQTVRSGIDIAVAFMQIDPAAAKTVNCNKGIRKGFEMSGAPMDILRSEDEVAELNQAEAEAAQQAQMMNALQQGAGIAKDAAQAEAMSGQV